MDVAMKFACAKETVSRGKSTYNETNKQGHQKPEPGGRGKRYTLTSSERKDVRMMRRSSAVSSLHLSALYAPVPPAAWCSLQAFFVAALPMSTNKIRR